MHPYDYPGSETRFRLRLREATRRGSHYLVTFPTAHPTRYWENNTALGEYFVPSSGERFPLVILLHGLGDHSVLPCRILARHLARKGIACFVLYLVFHSRRTPEALKTQPLSLTAGNWLEVFQVSVTDVRQVVDWAKGREEIDDQQVAVFGISLGGFVSAIAMGIDKRIMAGVFMVTGGNLEEITWEGKSHAVRRAHSCTQEECHNVYGSYRQYLAEVNQKGFENVTPARECFLFDPTTFAPYLRGRPVLMLNARWDNIIPRQSTQSFWEACGRPRIIWLPANHITIYLWHPLIRREVTTFLRSTFRMEERPLHS